MTRPTRCSRCPCPDICLSYWAFCGWSTEDPQDPIKIRHIIARSTIGDRGSAEAARPAETPPTFDELEAARMAFEAMPPAERRPCCPG